MCKSIILYEATSLYLLLFNLQCEYDMCECDYVNLVWMYNAKG